MGKETRLPGSEFTKRQELFVREYLIDLNATQAAIRAGYAKKDANTAGYKLMQLSHVQQRISELQQARAARTDLKADNVLLELKRLAFSDVRKFFTEDGRLKDIASLDDNTAAAVASVKVVTKTLPTPRGEPPEVEYVHEIKLWDKNSALHKTMQHLGLLIEKVEHRVADDDPFLQFMKDVMEGKAQSTLDIINPDDDDP